MKQLLFASGFAIAGLFSYKWINGSGPDLTGHKEILLESRVDTVPKAFDTTGHRMFDTTSRKKFDTSRSWKIPNRDTAWLRQDTSHQ